MKLNRTGQAKIATMLFLVLAFCSWGVNRQAFYDLTELLGSGDKEDANSTEGESYLTCSDPTRREEDPLKATFQPFHNSKIRQFVSGLLTQPVRYINYYQATVREGLSYLWNPTIPVAQKKLLI